MIVNIVDYFQARLDLAALEIAVGSYRNETIQ